MQNGEIIPALIARIRQNNTDNLVIRSKLEHYYLSVGSESLWDSRELIMKAISEQNKLIKEEYDNSNK